MASPRGRCVTECKRLEKDDSLEKKLGRAASRIVRGAKERILSPLPLAARETIRERTIGNIQCRIVSSIPRAQRGLNWHDARTRDREMFSFGFGPD